MTPAMLRLQYEELLLLRLLVLNRMQQRLEEDRARL